jgi:hypothetical protein
VVKRSLKIWREGKKWRKWTPIELFVPKLCVSWWFSSSQLSTRVLFESFKLVEFLLQSVETVFMFISMLFKFTHYLEFLQVYIISLEHFSSTKKQRQQSAYNDQREWKENTKLFDWIHQVNKLFTRPLNLLNLLKYCCPMEMLLFSYILFKAQFGLINCWEDINYLIRWLKQVLLNGFQYWCCCLHS